MCACVCVFPSCVLPHFPLRLREILDAEAEAAKTGQPLAAGQPPPKKSACGNVSRDRLSMCTREYACGSGRT